MSSYATRLRTRKRQYSFMKPPCQNVTTSNILSTTLLNELTMDILSRLPVNALIRFYSVSKSWYILLSSSYFIKYHIQCSNNASILNNHRLLGGDLYNICFSLSRPLSSISNDLSPIPSLPIDLTLEIWLDALIIGSCNGLICWIDYSESNNYICYLNPTTKMKARSPNFHFPLDGDFCYNLFGFGYNHINDSYKTVAIHCDPTVDTIQKKTIVKVYELGAPSAWRKVQSFPCVPMRSSFSDGPCGVFVNGTLNWLCTRPNDSLVIVSVDLMKDTCKEVSLPRFVDENIYQVTAEPNLWVLRGCLCFSHKENDTQFVLWQMEVYGDASSWNKLFEISYKDVRIYRDIPDYPKPLIILANGDVVLQITKHGRFICYNPMRNSYKDFTFLSGMNFFKTILHIDSLVSPCPTPHDLRIRGHNSRAKLTIGTSG